MRCRIYTCRTMKHTTALLLALALAASSATAFAKPRFEWIDDASGRKVFSDRPPPGGADSVRGFVDHAPGARVSREQTPQPPHQHLA